MKKTPADIVEYYDRQIIPLITEKYGMSSFEALRQFIASETHRMLDDAELEMWEFSPLVIFDLWENEKVTGNPRTSIYIRAD